MFGGPEAIIKGPDGAGVLLSAEILARHHPERSPYYSLLPELIAKPYEIWVSLDEHIATGRVELRKRYVRLQSLDREKRGIFFVAQATKGQLVAWTLVPVDDLRRLNGQRTGKLLWARQCKAPPSGRGFAIGTRYSLRHHPEPACKVMEL